jgi:hypothetical protein
MQKIVNLLVTILIFYFFFNIFKFYSSNKNMKNVSLNRLNIDHIIKNKVLDIPTLPDDTVGVIEFNSSFSEELEDDKPRSFWKLLKFK